jgi:hypothetical protein
MALYRRQLTVLALLLLRVRVLRDNLFRVLMGVSGVFERLFGEFVSGEMVSFSMRGGGGAMGVRRKVM